MARKRTGKNAHLPTHLLINNDGYYSYHSVLTKKYIGLGTDMVKAIDYAEKANRELEKWREAKERNKFSVHHGAVDHRGLLSRDLITRKALIYDYVCGIYFLLSNDEIVYVGQSQSVLTRIAAHHQAKEKVFNRIFVIECKPVELNHLEALYIDKYKPRHNITIPPVCKTDVAWEASLSNILQGATYEQR